MKKCASCGSMLEDDYKVCPFCGANAERVSVSLEKPASENYNGYQQPPVNAPQMPQNVPQNVPQYGYGAPAPVPAQPPKPTNGVGIAGMVFGILSYIFCWVPVFGLILGLIGVILSGVGLSRKDRYRLNGFAIAGLILSIIAMVVGLIMTIVLLAAAAATV